MTTRQQFRGGSGRGPEICEYEPQAVYYPDMDYIEYITADEISVSDRIDEYLTLIWDKERTNVIGFRIKGFRYLFREKLQPLLRLTDDEFLTLVKAVEVVFTEVGDDLLGHDRKRERAYRAAYQLAKNGDVKVYDLPAAA